MEGASEILKKTKLFGEIPENVIKEYIEPYSSVIDYEKDSCVIMDGSRVDTIKVLISGRVNIVYYYSDGNYSLASSEKPYRILALDLIATKTKKSPYCAVAAEDSSVLSIPSELILSPGSLPEKYRQCIINQLLIMLSHLHMQKEKRLMILSKSGLRDRIITYLSLQTRFKENASIEIPFTREEMAAYLCVNRSKLSHELSLMKKEGIIDFAKNRFILFEYRQDSFYID